MQIQVARNSRIGAQQGGFTLIELIVVIVILGVLAATALPKFANLGTDARIAKMQGARAALVSASNMYRGRFLANNSVAASYDGVSVNAAGYPDLAGMSAAVPLGDYDVSTFSTTGVVSADSGHLQCKVTYDPATGTATLSATAANC